MRTRIQRSMLLVITVTLVATFLLLSSTFYVQTVNNLKEEVQTEAVYVQTALDMFGTKYLEDMDKVKVQTRMTLIDETGEVIYDTKKDSYTFENHAERTEVISAIETGKGEDLRTSETVGKRTYYYAILLENGMVLRASKTIDSLLPAIWKTIPYMGVIAIFMALLAYYMSKWKTKRLIAPINEIDPAKPLEHKVYEELTPLLTRIDEQNKAKEQVANLRKEFSANVSHELKTPLTSISGYAEIMKSGMVKEEDMVSFSERIYNEASRLIRLVEDIIKLSHLEEEQVTFEKEQVDLYLLTQEIVDCLALPAAKRKIEMEVTGDSACYFGVRRILEEMIYNLCDNAIKYNVEGGKVHVHVATISDGVKVTVEDTGIGIPKEQVDRIFERFYRVDKSHSKETGGTGLGLSIVKHGAIYHHAQIQVESEVGKGTRMELVFTE